LSRNRRRRPKRLGIAGFPARGHGPSPATDPSRPGPTRSLDAEDDNCIHQRKEGALRGYPLLRAGDRVRTGVQTMTKTRSCQCPAASEGQAARRLRVRLTAWPGPGTAPTSGWAGPATGRSPFAVMTLRLTASAGAGPVLPRIGPARAPLTRIPSRRRSCP
jgi:hypothetical protein